MTYFGDKGQGVVEKTVLLCTWSPEEQMLKRPGGRRQLGCAGMAEAREPVRTGEGSCGPCWLEAQTGS